MLPLDMPAFGWWVGFAKNTKIMDPYFQHFSSISSEIIITK
jgi:beta-lactamase class D